MFSRILRRTHMYAALALGPWLLMYALSTMAMNHRAWFRAHEATGPVFQKEKELTYSAPLPENAKPREIGAKILADLQLPGAFTANPAAGGQRIVIIRQDPLRLRRLTYTPADHTLTVEREEFRPSPFLERLHRRRGYSSGFALESTWSVFVDAAILAMIFWVLSGLWMWWQMRRTRLVGGLCAAAGCLLFAAFIFTI